MSIDMEQFKATFIEESLEGLDTMESVLLEMQPGDVDGDAVDNIFRAAHSIKGGSATFGFQDITQFTHVVETLLDQVRGGERAVTREAIDLFLQSVDIVRDMLASAQEGFDINQAQVDEVKAGLERMLGSEALPAATDVAEAEADDAGEGWVIDFRPFPDMLRSGNDVVRLFRELAELGEFAAEADLSALPALVDMAPEEACLSWRVSLRGDIPRASVAEVFEWVDDECELSIVPLTGPAQVDAEGEPAINPDVTGAPALQASAPAVERRSDERRQGERRKSRGAGAESSSIRVSIDKVDALINMMGELVITQSMLSQLGEDFTADKLERLKDGLAELERNTRELQENVMSIRMLPISFAFNRFPRMVHDLSSKLGKQVELKMSGEHTELDKTVMEKIGDPLVHLVRNAIDHGIESPEARLAAGKPAIGTVHLNACHQGGNILIAIRDDGGGLNRERILAKAIERGLVGESEGAGLSDAAVFDFLFQPGFSTAEVVSDVSGRGVGMDVVKRNISALGGTIDVQSRPGEGSIFTIHLPLTLAILDGQLVRVGEQTFIVPLVSIIESLQMEPARVNAIAGAAELYKLRDDYLPIIRLYDAFGLKPDSTVLTDGLLVVVEGNGRQVGLLVDDLLGQQQVVIKSLETNFKKVEGLSGATILGDGTVALIVDIGGIIQLSQDGTRRHAQIAAA